MDSHNTFDHPMFAKPRPYDGSNPFSISGHAISKKSRPKGIFK